MDQQQDAGSKREPLINNCAPHVIDQRFHGQVNHKSNENWHPIAMKATSYVVPIHTVRDCG